MKTEKTTNETYKCITNDGTEFDNSHDAHVHEWKQLYKHLTDDPECGYMQALDNRRPMGWYDSEDKYYIWFKPTTFRGAMKVFSATESITFKSCTHQTETIEKFVGHIVCIEDNSCGDIYYNLVEYNIEDVVGTLSKLGYKVEKEEEHEQAVES